MKPEILAPVGSKEALIAAIYSGADGVYLGASRFNARQNATNFGDNDLSEAILFCKQHGVKCYLTLNILIKDQELEEALNLSRFAFNAGIDAVIVQDLGLAAMLKENIPQLTLHGSTQLSVHSPAALSVLKELGFKRVVPARELSRNELKDICNEASRLGMEVEAFIHGALCMSLSGQCYFSAHLGGRSANRGLCAGTCRLPFSAKGGTEYDLSLKDLSLINKAKELSDIGVASFKIEGRMKKAEYVAAAVSTLRSVVDTGSAPKEAFETLEQVFSRSGFTDGYFSHTLGKSMFGVRTEQDKITSDEVLKRLHGLYRRPFQRIPLDFKITIKAGAPLTLTANCQGLEITQTANPPEKAMNVSITKERIENSLSKLGGTPYFINKIQIDLEEGLSIPSSALNNLRKNVIFELDRQRTITTKPTVPKITYAPTLKKKKIRGWFLRFNSIEQIPSIKELKLPLTGYSLPAEELVAAKDTPMLLGANNSGLLPTAELPRGATNDHTTKQLLNKLKEKGINAVVAGNIATVKLALENGFCVFGGFGLNLFNNQALKTISHIGVFKGVISAELSLKETEYLSFNGFETYMFCYGRFPLMLTRNCPGKNGIGCSAQGKCEITDRKDEHFPLMCRNGFCEILNSRPTNIADSTNSISCDGAYFHFTTEEKNEVFEILKGFMSEKITSGKYTRGLSKNGVL